MISSMHVNIINMKNYLILLFLFIGYSICSEYDGDIEWMRRIQKSQDNEDDYIVYPCATSDINCIRKFFTLHGQCKPTYGPVPDPYIMEQMILPMTTSNISFTIANAKVRGLNGKITSFYINKKTDNLVIALESKPLGVSSPQITFIYHRKGKEPVTLTDAFFVKYTSVTFTAVIPNIKNLQLAKADVYAYLDDGNPNYGFGPGVMLSFDPVVHRSLSDLISRIPENAKESLGIQAFNLMNIFIQHNICDFGLKIGN